MIEIHQPPTSRSSMACPKTRMARMGAKDYQWNATPSGPRHERRADLPFGAYDLIDLLSGESHETRRTRSQDDTDRRRRH